MRSDNGCVFWYTLVPVFQIFYTEMLGGGPYVWGPKPVAKNGHINE
jgi:hypothetical protein